MRRKEKASISFQSPTLGPHLLWLISSQSQWISLGAQKLLVSLFKAWCRMRGHLRLGGYLINPDASSQLADTGSPGEVLETGEAVSQPPAWRSELQVGVDMVFQQPGVARGERWSRSSSFGSSLHQYDFEPITTTSGPLFIMKWGVGPSQAESSWEGPPLSCEPPNFLNAGVACETSTWLWAQGPEAAGACGGSRKGASQRICVCTCVHLHVSLLDLQLLERKQQVLSIFVPWASAKEHLSNPRPQLPRGTAVTPAPPRGLGLLSEELARHLPSLQRLLNMGTLVFSLVFCFWGTCAPWNSSGFPVM